MSNKVSRAFSKVINLVVAATAQGASKGELGSPDTTEEMKSIARTAAEEGIVMLKNNGVLPIAKDENVCVFSRLQRIGSSSATARAAMSTSPTRLIFWTA